MHLFMGLAGWSWGNSQSASQLYSGGNGRRTSEMKLNHSGIQQGASPILIWKWWACYCYGGNRRHMRCLGGEMSCAFEQQHANGGLGFTSGFSKISGCRTFCTNTCPATQIEKDMPIDDTAHRGKAEQHCRCPVLVLWKQHMALYIEFNFPHID
jgi:hypothetical protein